MTAHESERIQSVETAFEILDYLQHNEEAGVTEIADALSVSKSTAHGHLSTMESIGHVVKVDGTYRVGLSFLELGHHARSRYNLYESAKAEADQLAEMTGERCQIMVPEGHHGVYIYQTAGEQAVRTDSHIGSTVDLHCTAVGKCYLANLPEDELEAYLDDVGLAEQTEHTITDREAFRDELETVRQQGYALNREERIIGMRAVGAPIVTDQNDVLGAISVSVPTTRIDDRAAEDELPKQVQRSARVIAIRTTYS
ncbi:IclR family transcriptional regulator [Natrinema versiforme]|uniref:Transcriptional regulator, IclR family protein n=1 Tax=Natrinema versiforme JCM 10478 TaxID=1227496 RepID=L9XMB7_9EURY|nr:IclR family transcriptional regulator [Natrinema versiforme]ELY62934.1 transcriptional regulator, IclR family protein [Natrinema versiforme JCM 10478]